MADDKPKFDETGPEDTGQADYGSAGQLADEGKKAADEESSEEGTTVAGR